jgi:transposase
MDHRAQTIKARNKLGNQLLAYERRTDHMSPEVLADLEAWRLPIEQRLAELDKDVARLVATLAQHDPLVLATLGVPGIGPITVAGLTVYVDLAKAPSASSLWKYVGLHVASHERYVKGVKGGGNKTLRTILFTTATSAVKMGDSSPYRIVYDRVKARLAASEKIVSSRGTDGKLREVAWKDAKPSHRHGAAMRAIIKHFLADYWFVGRTLAGLPTRSLYVEEQLGHTGIIAPQDRGWSA